MLVSMIPIFTIRTTHTTRTMDFDAFFGLVHRRLYTHIAVLSSGMEILVWDRMVHVGREGAESAQPGIFSSRPSDPGTVRSGRPGRAGALD